MSKSKFAGIFQSSPTEPADAAQAGPVETDAPAQPRDIRPIGRPPGKRSNPAWKQYSVLLKRDTQRDAINALRERGEGDLSGLVQMLLESWLEQQKH